MISRVRRTSGQDTKVDIPLPHYTIPIEKFADKRVK
uniref:Uncharacterized protein n=3 Tax=Phlebotominae TaxID=7198 RepID=A0A1B0CF19_LUTLO